MPLGASVFRSTGKSCILFVVAGAPWRLSPRAWTGLDCTQLAIDAMPCYAAAPARGGERER